MEKITLENLNSQITIKQSDWAFAIYGTEVISRCMIRKIAPVYLVDPTLMDRLYPPEKRRFLHPGCTEEFLKSFDRSLSERKIPPEAYPGCGKNSDRDLRSV